MANVNSTQDPDINKLIERINRCCNESLVLKVGKCFRLRCICSTSEFCEFILDLSSGNGHCGFVESTWPENIDVVITVRKDTLLALINGDISPISAYIDGSIQIQGSVADATLLRFLAERAKEIE
jgi:putative sterol carrier protein